MIAEQPPQSHVPQINPAETFSQGLTPTLEGEDSLRTPGLDMPDPGAYDTRPAEVPSAWSRMGAAFESIRQDPAARRVGHAALVGAGVRLGVIKESGEGGVSPDRAGIAKVAAELVLSRGLALKPIALQAAQGARARGTQQFRQELMAEMRSGA